MWSYVLFLGYLLPMIIFLSTAAWTRWFATPPPYEDKRSLGVALFTITAFVPFFNWYMLLMMLRMSVSDWLRK